MCSNTLSPLIVLLLTDLCVGWGARLMFSQFSHLLWLLLSTQFSWLCSTYVYRLPVSQGYMKILSHLFYGSLTLKIFPLSLWLIHLLLQLVPNLRPVEPSVSHLFPIYFLLTMLPAAEFSPMPETGSTFSGSKFIGMLARPPLATLSLSLTKVELGRGLSFSSRQEDYTHCCF